MKKTIKGFVDSEGNEYQYKDEIARSQNQNLEEEINSNKTYMDKVKTELKNDNKTLNGRIDTILTGTVNTTKLVTVHSATIRNNSASDLTFKISSKDNETLKSIKDKSPTVINANVIAKALDGVAINGKGIPSSYNVESTNDEYVITVYSGSSSVVGQYVFMAVVTIAYEDIATDISSAELKDVRAGADGTVYKSAGEAVRQQIGSLKSDTSRIKKSLKTTYVDMNLFALGTINKDTGEEESSNKILRSIIDVNATEDITIKLPKGYQWNVAHWLAGKYRSDLWNENGWYQNLTIEKTTANYKYRILIRRSDGADITLSELIGAAETNREDLQSFDKIDDLKKKLNEVDKKVDNLSTETDTTLTKTGKAADSAVVGKEIGSLKESLEECIDVTASRNILAFENYTRGKYYSASSGSDRYNDSFTAIDDYVKIEPNTDYVFSIFSDGNYETMPNAVVIQYDAGRKYISGADVKTFKTAINARYIRLSMANVYFDKQVMLEKGTEPSKIYESPLKKYKIKNECIDDTQICDKVISILKIKENEITVGASDCNFETLQEAISSIKDNTELNRYIICLKEGTYNLADGLDITDSSAIGVTVPNWATIVGIGNRENVILECRLDSKNQNISALNFKETSGIENLSIIGENTRYAIHDDFARESKGYDRRIKHCIIRGENTYYSTVYGAGTGDGANWKFEDVIFDGTKAGANYKKGNTFTVHNILKSQKNRDITFANCRFLSGMDNNVKLKTLAYRTATGLDSANDMLTNVQFFGCEFSGEIGFELSEENASVYGSGCLYYVTGFGNKNANHNIVTTDGKDYSGRVNLI